MGSLSCVTGLALIILVGVLGAAGLFGGYREVFVGIGCIVLTGLGAILLGVGIVICGGVLQLLSLRINRKM
jgi:hypothetical protein